MPKKKEKAKLRFGGFLVNRADFRQVFNKI
jgi:hypothetical protein